MDYIKISAKTVSDAIMEASIQLETSSDNIEYEIIENGSSGFLGFGSKRAVINAKKKEFVEKILVKETKSTVNKVTKETTKEVTKEVIRVPADKDEVEKAAITFLKEIFQAMKMEVQISAILKGEDLDVEMSGEDMGVLIGKRGQTLDSLQYLTSLIVNKGKASYIRVKLDTENYRNRRKETLENLAKNIAFKVKRTRKPVFLEPMNPYERRIIHSALQEDPSITTHSEGDEPYRKVVVTLKK